MPGNGQTGFVLIIGVSPNISLDLLAYKEYFVIDTLRKEGETVILSQPCPQAIQYFQTSHTWES